MSDPPENFNDRVKRHQIALEDRGFPLASETLPPTGQAVAWHDDVTRVLPKSGRMVARQIARLAGRDSQVTIPWRSLADAVGRADKAGRPVAYTQRGVAALVTVGWLRVETVGAGRGARTTFYMVPGEQSDWLADLVDDDDDDELI